MPFDSGITKERIIYVLEHPGYFPDWVVDNARKMAEIMGRSVVREGARKNIPPPERFDESGLTIEEIGNIVYEGFGPKELK